MTVRLRWNVNLEGRARRTSERAAEAIFLQLNSRFQQALRAAVFEWPNQTTRSNGQVAGTTRNIVDTANLFQSNTGPEINGLRVRYTWRTPYATAVHEGYELENGTMMPARPWTSAVLGSEPVVGIEPIDRAALKDVWLKAFRQS